LVARIKAERMHEIRAHERAFKIVESGGCQNLLLKKLSACKSRPRPKSNE
jgi:hypothetical protein